MRRLINRTPHAIVLRSSTGTETVVPVSAEGDCRVEQTSGQFLPGYWSAYADAPAPVTDEEKSGTFPCAVYRPSRYGSISGLPFDVEPGDVVIVSLMVLEAARRKIAGLEDLKRSAQLDPSQWFWDDNHERELRVLRSLAAPGTGPQDGAIRYPKDHPRAGQVQAVTRLISVD